LDRPRESSRFVDLGHRAEASGHIRDVMEQPVCAMHTSCGPALHPAPENVAKYLPFSFGHAAAESPPSPSVKVSV